MWQIKSIEEINQSIDLISQQTDMNKNIEHRNILKHQFQIIIQENKNLNLRNKNLLDQLKENPEYQKKQALQIIKSIYSNYI